MDGLGLGWIYPGGARKCHSNIFALPFHGLSIMWSDFPHVLVTGSGPYSPVCPELRYELGTLEYLLREKTASEMHVAPQIS